jgi:hypothetical protein
MENLKKVLFQTKIYFHQFDYKDLELFQNIFLFQSLVETLPDYHCDKNI